MNTTLKVGLAAAVVAVAALIGINYLAEPRVGGPGPAEPTPTATPEPTPTPEPSVAEASIAPQGLLSEGPHVLTDGEALAEQPALSMTVTIPASDWYGEPGEGILVKNDTAEAPEGAGMIVFFGGVHVYGDPCEWATTMPETPATTVDELVNALAAQASRDASEPVDVMVGGYAGKSITLHVPGDAVFSECGSGQFGSWGIPDVEATPARYAQDPGQIDEVYVVDVDGVLAIIDTAYYAGTPTEHVEELRAIVESATFGE